MKFQMHTLLSLVMEIRKTKSEGMQRTTAFRIVYILLDGLMIR